MAQPERTPVAGVPAIRAALAPYFGVGLKLAVDNVNIITTEHGLALVTAPWVSTAIDANGMQSRLYGIANIVMRRQADGTWRYLIDDPGVGRQSDLEAD